MLNGRWFAGRMVLVEYLAPKVRTVRLFFGCTPCVRCFGGRAGVALRLMPFLFFAAVRVGEQIVLFVLSAKEGEMSEFTVPTYKCPVPLLLSCVLQVCRWCLGDSSCQ